LCLLLIPATTSPNKNRDDEQKKEDATNGTAHCSTNNFSSIPLWSWSIRRGIF
jgi:hypothetical protein